MTGDAQHCPGCELPVPADWCWQQRAFGCAVGKPPRWALESPGIFALWQEQTRLREELERR